MSGLATHTNDDDETLEFSDCRYGRMYFLREDRFIGRALREYGEWAQAEIDLLCSLLDPGCHVVDGGAFVGTHALAFARTVGPSGRVYAFEPHPIFFEVLKRNVEINELRQVRLFKSGLTADHGHMAIVTDDMAQATNFGGTRLDPTPSRSAVQVAVRTLDSCKLKRCDLIKLDIEGMEESALRGATDSIRRFEPIVFTECNSVDAGWAVTQLMRSFDYKVFVSIAPAFNVGNFRGSTVNAFGDAKELGLLCVPESRGNVFSRLIQRGESVIPLESIDDLVLSLIKKPQYKYEVLQQTKAAAICGNSFWLNESESTELQARASHGDDLRQRVADLTRGLELAAAAQQLVERQMAESRELTGQAGARGEELRERAQFAEQVATERMQKLQDLVRELEEEKAARAREHDSTSANQASWENYRQELLRALEETKRHGSDVDQRLQTLVREVDEERAEHGRQLEEWKARCAEWELRAARLDGQIEAMRSSLSWRLTSPMRWIRRHLAK